MFTTQGLPSARAMSLMYFTSSSTSLVSNSEGIITSSASGATPYQSFSLICEPAAMPATWVAWAEEAMPSLVAGMSVVGSWSVPVE